MDVRGHGYLQNQRRTGILALFLLGIFSIAAYADDGIFPPAPAAKSFIDFDGRGFLIQGHRTFLASGSLHYSRVPRALWRDRLLRIKRAGFNTVQTYAFWNLHEPQEGRWDFSGDKDLDAFLKLVHEIGLYAVVRPGPYVCAEWDSGGYPVWLRFKPGLKVREENPAFAAAVDHWYDKVMPIIAANQISKGGCVLMVQLENEHPAGWGKDMPNGYFRHLRDRAVALGIEVPYFFSGLHHGFDPAGDKPWDSKDRANPWYSTELWPGWYNRYGPLDDNEATRVSRAVWKIIAYGGNGFNLYMFHGGTNFDTWNDDEGASSYDYGAAIGQTGDIRPIYYRLKAAALFARSFADILENSENTSATVQNVSVNNAIHVTARKGPAGELLFLDNNSAQRVSTQVRDVDGTAVPNQPGGTLVLAPGEIMPVVRSFPLLPDVTLELAAARILGIARQGATTTLVIYGDATISQSPRDMAFLRFRVPAEGVTLSPTQNLFKRDPANPTHLTLETFFTEGGLQEAQFSVGVQRIRILSASRQDAERIWFVENQKKDYVIYGPNYVGNFEMQDETMRVTNETRVAPSRNPNAVILETFKFPLEKSNVIYGDEEKPIALSFLNKPQDSAPEVPALASWEMRRGDIETKSGFFTSGWKASETPLAMGADGDTSAYAWYRSFLFVAKAGAFSLELTDAGDWIGVWVNGKWSGSSHVQQRFDRPRPRSFTVSLNAGQNTLALLTAHYGRRKLFNYIGPLDKIDAKGIAGPVLLSRTHGATLPIGKWRWMEDTRAQHDAPDMLPADLVTKMAQGKEAAAGDDIFNNRSGFAWERVVLGTVPGPNRLVHFENVDDNVTVYLNGKKLMRHEGWNQPFDVPLNSAWKEGATNELELLIENTSGPGGVMGPAELQTGLPPDAAPIRGWKMHGGLGDPAASPKDWLPLPDTAAPGPVYYRTAFENNLPEAQANSRVLRLSLVGMTRGFVWLNGHNLGRYPEKVPVEGVWLPECWLKQGKNSLIIFDEEGAVPKMARLVTEENANRQKAEMISEKSP